MLYFVVIVSLSLNFLAKSNSVKATPVFGHSLLAGIKVLTEDFYDMPESCTDKNFCFDKGHNYPDHKIKKLFENSKTIMPMKKEKEVDFDFRQGIEPYDNPECPSNTTKKPIYFILDENDLVRVVIQSPKFQQIYTVTQCEKEGLITEDTPHLLKGSSLFRKYNFHCANVLMKYEFFVLEETFSPQVERVRVKDGIPVCCKCIYTNK